MSTRIGRPPRVDWPQVKRDVDSLMPLWEVMARHDVDRVVIYNQFRRYGWDTSRICRPRRQPCCTT